MEAKEIIEQQTLARLDKEEPTAKDLADGIKLLAGKMWSKEEMTAFIDARHNALCASCKHYKPKAEAKEDAPETITAKLVAIVGGACAALASIATALINHYTKS